MGCWLEAYQNRFPEFLESPLCESGIDGVPLVFIHHKPFSYANGQTLFIDYGLTAGWKSTQSQPHIRLRKFEALSFAEKGETGAPRPAMDGCCEKRSCPQWYNQCNLVAYFKFKGWRFECPPRDGL